LNQTERILIVDDELNVRHLLSEVVRKAGYEPHQAENGLEGVEKCRLLKPEVVLMDLRMPVMEGMEAFAIIHEEMPEVQVVLLTAFGNVGIAMEAMKRGAFDYLVKPANVAEVRTVLERALAVRKQQAESLLNGEAGLKSEPDNRIVGCSAVMQNLFKSVGRVAQSNATVLISGESGSGKEVIAKAIHENSLRKDQPFVRIDCGSIPEGLMESELFGHEKGAFTGAIAAKPGKFEVASGGTLFIDEVGDLPLPLQVKLLRAIQEREFERVGGNAVLRMDVRIIAATNRNLPEMVEQGRFREDLFYRLNVVPLHVPALRERAEDIPLLVDYFIKKAARAAGCMTPLLTQEARELLLRYSWPGNVRELANVLERAVVMSNGVIDLPDVSGIANPLLTSTPRAEKSEEIVVPFAGTLREMTHCLEREIIIRTLKKHGGNRMRSAQALDISRRSLLYKLEEHGLGEREEKE
jgi:two-component system, NtrC family, response regulator AtoC